MLNMLKNYIYDEPESLSMEDAKAIMDFKMRSTFRSLSLAFLGVENQMDGRDLARDAARRILGISLQELFALEWGADPAFDERHSHVMGGFFWWE
jgi:hypothetical protein